jgi:hypothetical protein
LLYQGILAALIFALEILLPQLLRVGARFKAFLRGVLQSTSWHGHGWGKQDQDEVDLILFGWFRVLGWSKGVWPVFVRSLMFPSQLRPRHRVNMAAKSATTQACHRAVGQGLLPPKPNPVPIRKPTIAPRTVNAFIVRRSNQQNPCHGNPDLSKIEKTNKFGPNVVIGQEPLAGSLRSNWEFFSYHGRN